jgi:oxygen-dependent protoporphyrinogen oxidase
MKNPQLAEKEDAWIGEVARKEFQIATGFQSRVLMVSRTAVPAWDESWDAVSALELPATMDACSNWAARPGIPGRLAQARSLAKRLAGRSTP